ncbi:hypothetical protein MTO96_019484 [Rhipicephalus appendiculatus]
MARVHMTPQRLVLQRPPPDSAHEPRPDPREPLSRRASIDKSISLGKVVRTTPPPRSPISSRSTSGQPRGCSEEDRRRKQQPMSRLAAFSGLAVFFLALAILSLIVVRSVYLRAGRFQTLVVNWRVALWFDIVVSQRAPHEADPTVIIREPGDLVALRSEQLAMFDDVTYDAALRNMSLYLTGGKVSPDDAAVKQLRQDEASFQENRASLGRRRRQRRRLRRPAVSR